MTESVNRRELLECGALIAADLDAARAHLIAAGPPLARALASARDSEHAAAGQIDSLWQQRAGLVDALRAVLVFVEYDGHVPTGDEQMEIPL